MIIEEEKKLEIVDDNQNSENTSTSDFKTIPNTMLSHSHCIKIVCAFIIIFLILMLIILGVFTFYNYKNKSIISNGIYINSVDVSHLTKEDAKQKLENYYNEQFANDITLAHNDYTTYIKTSEINLSVDIDSAVNYAFSFGKDSNIFKDNFQIFSAMINGVNIMPTVSYDEKTLNDILNTAASELPDAVVQSGYYMENNNLIITKGSDGVVIDVASTSEKIKQKLSNLTNLNEPIEIDTISKSPDKIDLDKIYGEIHKDAKDAYFTTEPHVVYPSEDGLDFKMSLDEAKKLLETSEKECTIPLKVVHPNVTTNMIGDEAFPDLLATFSTKYATSNKDRTTNLRLAANKINGYVLLPGETFSYNSVVGERTISAGYKEASIYENGEVVQGLGGGICQISTTLFNAALFSNLEIVELYNHQFVPSYVTAGRDATVVYGVKDFKFKNTRNYAIKITCSVEKGRATFNIKGLKQDNEYDVDVYANITSKTSSYIKSTTYRRLKQNGKTVKTEKIMNATYKTH